MTNEPQRAADLDAMRNELASQPGGEELLGQLDNFLDKLETNAASKRRPPSPLTKFARGLGKMAGFLYGKLLNFTRRP